MTNAEKGWAGGKERKDILRNKHLSQKQTDNSFGNEAHGTRLKVEGNCEMLQ